MIMVFLDIGRSGLMLAWAGSFTPPDVITIGTGSGVVSVNNSGLVTPALSVAFTSRDISTQKEVTFVSDFGATTLSGLSVKEFGVQKSGATLFNREGFGAVVFDGTSELQISVTFENF